MTPSLINTAASARCSRSARWPKQLFQQFLSPRHAVCCECLRYHLDMKQLPACCFPKEVERTYDRSFERFAQLLNSGAV